MPEIFVQDKGAPITSKRQITEEGFMRVPGLAARTGIYEYRSSELPGLLPAGTDPNRIVRVLRSPNEVFDTESLGSYVGKDVTVIHPDTFVNPDNYQTTTAGVVLGAKRSGEHVEVDLLIKSRDAMAALESGIVYLSPGYAAIYDPAPPGEQGYDFEQKKIRVNHVALVPAGRGGATVKVSDTEAKMPRVTLPTGHSVEVADEATATLISFAVNDSSSKIAGLERRVKDAEEALKKTASEKSEVEDELEKVKKESEAKDAKMSDSLPEVVDAILSVLDDARKLAGSDFKPSSMRIETIQREALKVKRPALDSKDASAEQIAGAFHYAVASLSDTGGGAYNQLSRDAAAHAAAPAPSARDQAKLSLVGGYKTPFHAIKGDA